MRDVVIADTSCLVLLEKIHQLDLLKSCYDQVFITPAIEDEFRNLIPPWIKVRSPSNEFFQKILMRTIGPGESSALALAMEIPKAILILDDLKARKIAKSLDLNLTGTLGVIVGAKKKGVIPSVSSILDQLQETDFRVSPSVVKKIKEIAGE